MSGHLPYGYTCVTFVEEQELFGTPGSNVRVDVLSEDGETAKVRIEDCGVHARQGQLHTVRTVALNGGRR
jgi:hypothetical protein